MSIIMREAFDLWQEMRDDFELFRHAQYERAGEACRGELLNAAGRAEGIDAYSLFLGPTARAVKYASEELQQWWIEPGNQRMTVASFEQQWLAARGRGVDPGPAWAEWSL